MYRRMLAIMSAVVLAGGCGGGDGGGVTNPPGAGTLSGRVSGPGGGVPDAQVALTGGPSQQTDAEGRFSFTNVSAGAKTVTLTPPAGFVLASGETAGKTVTVTAGAAATVDWTVRLSDASARTVEVGLTSNRFSSADVTVPVGSTIEWMNQTATTHTITPDNPSQAGAWNDITIAGSGTVFTHTFGTAGTFEYLCRLHAGMTGVIRVH